MITDEFKKIHNVKNVRSHGWNGGARIVVEFNDGRMYDKLLMGASNSQINNALRFLILNHSRIVQRRKKIDKLIEKI